MRTASKTHRRTIADPFTLVILSLLLATFALAASPLDLADISVTSPLRQEFTLAAGDARSGMLTIANRGAAAAIVTITQADFAFDAIGSVGYEDANSSTNSNASWIDAPSRVEVPAGAEVQVPFTIEVPDVAGLHGSFWSALRIQPESATNVTARSASDSVSTSVAVIVQYGITILTHVGVPESRTLQFEQPTFRQAPGSGDFSLDVVLHNPGTHVVSTQVWLELYDPSGGLVARIDADDLRVYPRVSTTTRFDLGPLDAQAYQAVVVADAGGSDVFGTRYSLDATR